MPVHRQKKNTTPTALGSTPEQPAPALPDQPTKQEALIQWVASKPSTLSAIQKRGEA